MRRIGLAIVLVLGTFTVLWGQSAADAKLDGPLKRLFPNATSFSGKQGDPPHFKAFAGGNTLAGVAFLTTDLTPLERGYDGPIKILVGMDPQGVLTGIVMIEHKEPFGDFSIDTGGFQGQFRNKNIKDNFKVGADIDAITRATISVTTATRSVRNGARRLARAVLAPPS
jgi:NosR/NirI family transcriptional regulator, nitrous oxide reductase regulator